MATQKFLSTDNDLFIVKFINSTTGFVFDGRTPEILGDLIKNNGNNGISTISRFNNSKMKFERCSKGLVKSLFNWETHTIEQLKKINYIK